MSAFPSRTCETPSRSLRRRGVRSPSRWSACFHRASTASFTAACGRRRRPRHQRRHRSAANCSPSWACRRAGDHSADPSLDTGRKDRRSCSRPKPTAWTGNRLEHVALTTECLAEVVAAIVQSWREDSLVVHGPPLSELVNTTLGAEPNGRLTGQSAEAGDPSGLPRPSQDSSPDRREVPRGAATTAVRPASQARPSTLG